MGNSGGAPPPGGNNNGNNNKKSGATTMREWTRGSPPAVREAQLQRSRAAEKQAKDLAELAQFRLNDQQVTNNTLAGQVQSLLQENVRLKAALATKAAEQPQQPLSSLPPQPSEEMMAIRRQLQRTQADLQKTQVDLENEREARRNVNQRSERDTPLASRYMNMGTLGFHTVRKPVGPPGNQQGSSSEHGSKYFSAREEMDEDPLAQALPKAKLSQGQRRKARERAKKAAEKEKMDEVPLAPAFPKAKLSQGQRRKARERAKKAAEKEKMDEGQRRKARERAKKAAKEEER
ncbi:hypothetical protein SLS58_007185 [Diplodia intermedia]|uniref:Uncharacterized protein n=1 Tax=Diplodia intermedia TaxID=856260 RepID=A0ABR3TL13_9PEZI